MSADVRETDLGLACAWWHDLAPQVSRGVVRLWFGIVDLVVDHTGERPRTPDRGDRYRSVHRPSRKQGEVAPWPERPSSA